VGRPVGVYKVKLVGPVPQFPRKIEDGIDAYLALQKAPPTCDPETGYPFRVR
jgi:hypothetical protein